MKGFYALIINVPVKLSIRSGALGLIEFNEGIWVYVGSALGTTSTSLESRISRHLSNKKKIHWHIDYLLRNSVKVIDVIWVETRKRLECKLAKILIDSREFEIGPMGFGASDCKSFCGSHIFYYHGKEDITRCLVRILRKKNLKPNTMQDLFSEK